MQIILKKRHARTHPHTHRDPSQTQQTNNKSFENPNTACMEFDRLNKFNLI